MARGFIAFALVALFASPAFAADLRAEIMNAAEHAEYSSEASSVEDAHFHLQHSLNCLVGPGGEGFDKHALNPCRGAGNGVIPDTRDATLLASFRSAVQKSARVLPSAISPRRRPTPPTRPGSSSRR